MIVIGFAQGVSPLVSFAYGAQEHSLAIALRKITSRMVLVAGIVVFGFTALCSGWYSTLFVESESVAQLVRSGAIVFGLSFLVVGVNVIASIYFTSIGKALESAIISAARGLVILLVCIFVLPPLLGMTGVWLVAPVTEVLTLGLSALFLYKDGRVTAVTKEQVQAAN
jgi:Na+-driven multidrug efflux pump